MALPSVYLSTAERVAPRSATKGPERISRVSYRLKTALRWVGVKQTKISRSIQEFKSQYRHNNSRQATLLSQVTLVYRATTNEPSLSSRTIMLERRAPTLKRLFAQCSSFPSMRYKRNSPPIPPYLSRSEQFIQLHI